MKDETVVLILFMILYNRRRIFNFLVTSCSSLYEIVFNIHFGTGFLICWLSLQSSYHFMEILTRIYVATL